MKVVADAGPLMALAKIGGLDVFFRLYPKVLTPPAVFREVVTEGLRLAAPDAAILAARYKSRDLEVVTPAAESLPIPAALGPGEEQSILLAIEHRAEWLLIDDADARRAALANLERSGSQTGLKGTLGVILSARDQGIVPTEEAVGLVEAVRQRPDVWIRADLCDRALGVLLNR